MKRFLLLLFLAAVLLMAFLPVKDTDFGWHYRCGNELLKSGSGCVTNTFSYFLAHYRSYNPHFLYDAALASVYDISGLTGVSIFGSLIFALSAAFYFILLKTRTYVKIITFIMLFYLSWTVFNLGLRSQIFTFMFFLASLLVIEKSKKNRLLLFLFIPLMTIWVNTHIGFFVGLIILLLYVFSEAWNTFTAKRHSFRPLLLACASFALTVLASLVNPFGVRVYAEILNHVTTPLWSMIAEWTTPNTWQMVLILALGSAAVIREFIRKPFSLYALLLVVCFGILALIGKRNLPFFYVVIFYTLTYESDRMPELAGSLLIPFLGVFTLFVGLVQLPRTYSFDTEWNIYCSQSVLPLPCKAIRNYPSLSGNVYANYEWGGFLEWQKPNIRVYVDGRMPAWKDQNGNSPYNDYLGIIQTKPGWNESLRNLNTDYLLIGSGTFLDLFLKQHSGKYHWKEVYRDPVAVIYRNGL